LEPLILVERRQQQAKLVLKIVQVGNWTIRQIRRFEYEALRHIAAAPQQIENDHFADEETIGCALEHKNFAPYDFADCSFARGWREERVV
jgi:hypothetical protein